MSVGQRLGIRDTFVFWTTYIVSLPYNSARISVEYFSPGFTCFTVGAVSFILEETISDTLHHSDKDFSSQRLMLLFPLLD